MYDQPKDLIDALQAAPATLAGVLHGVSQQQAAAARGGDEGWSVTGVRCHLRDAEERALERLLAMRDQDDPFLAGYDQDAWAVSAPTRRRTCARSSMHSRAIEQRIWWRWPPWTSWSGTGRAATRSRGVSPSRPTRSIAGPTTRPTARRWPDNSARERGLIADSNPLGGQA